jgi:uncharacterized repeat protein (TIGR03803 family)
MRGFVTSIAISALIALAATSTQSIQAQTYQIIHSFTGGQDGAYPYAGLTLDKGGNLYGTAGYGGGGSGTVYQLRHKGSGWTFNLLYSFGGPGDGGVPWSGVIIGPDGNLYGTTSAGGSNGDGTVFMLRPAPHACARALCPWTETVLYSFKGISDGAEPGYGNLVFDQAGKIYGTTLFGGITSPFGPCGNGSGGCGTVFELSPSNGGWNESINHIFSGNDGHQPLSGVVLDNAGNVYGTTVGGGASDWGTVYELTYTAGSGWAESVLYSFTGGADGDQPFAGLIFDPSGNLYGATADTYSDNATVFELATSGGTWTYSQVYGFSGSGDWCGPRGTLAIDGAGNVYGTTACLGAYTQGSVFKLTPSGGGTGTYTDLHDFTGPDGEYPYGSVAIDANGNLYGTTWEGGLYGYGVVWEITP